MAQDTFRIAGQTHVVLPHIQHIMPKVPALVSRYRRSVFTVGKSFKKHGRQIALVC